MADITESISNLKTAVDQQVAQTADIRRLYETAASAAQAKVDAAEQSALVSREEAAGLRTQIESLDATVKELTDKLRADDEPADSDSNSSGSGDSDSSGSAEEDTGGSGATDSADTSTGSSTPDQDTGTGTNTGSTGGEDQPSEQTPDTTAGMGSDPSGNTVL